MKNSPEYKQVRPVGDEVEAWETAEPIGRLRLRLLYHVCFSDGFEVTEEVALAEEQKQRVMAILAGDGAVELPGKVAEHLATAYPL